MFEKKKDVMSDFIEKLNTSTYNSLSIDDHNLDLHGWIDPNFELIFQKFVNNIQLNSENKSIKILEVGSWKGLSTSKMASILKNKNINGSVLSIDTWLGAPEFWTWGLNDPTRGNSLNFVNGYPSVFYTFTKNMKKLGLNDIVTPFPISSDQGFDVINYYKLRFDIIYIDASHEEEPVKKDIENSFKILNPNGVIFGDDYCNSWPGVMKAVNSFCKKFNLKLNTSGVLWWIFRPENILIPDETVSQILT